MKYLNILLLTTALFMNVSFAADDPEMEGLFIVALKQCTPEAIYKSGDALLNQAEFDEAITKYNLVLTFNLLANQLRGACLFKKGLIYSMQNKIDEAIKQWTAALTL